jgi:hypothetical protein
MKRDSQSGADATNNDKPSTGGGPAIYAAQFSIEEAERKQLLANSSDSNGQMPYTFFDTRGWGHGILVVNDFVIGRYWPVIGPQVTN